MTDHHFFASRDRLCKFAISPNQDDWVKCHLPSGHHYEDTYSIVYKKEHLDVQKYDCGCLIYRNKYHPEFSFPELIWIDFFGEEIGLGDKLVKFSIRKSNKK